MGRRGRPRNQEVRKVFCEVIQGVVYSDRCLFKLAKMIEGKTCENCILRELERLKEGKGYSKKGIERKGERQIGNIPEDTKQSYSIRTLVSLLGKSDQTIRNWVREGKIPAQKVGEKWHFKKEEIDLWISRRGENIKEQELTAIRTFRKEDIHPSDQNAGQVTDDE